MKRRRTIGTIIVLVILVLGISIINENLQKAKQIIIVQPSEKITYDISDELTISWTEIPGTAKYRISVYPLDIEITYISSYSFYVDGDYTETSILLSKHIYGGGKYIISVSSDVEGSEAGSIIIYLTMNSD